MIHTLQNDHLEIHLSSLGAELQNIIKGDQEYLWQGDSTYWGRRAPVLFPIVGALKEGYFVEKGAKYNMGQHGFARDMEFIVAERSETELTYELRSDEEILKKYPFEFKLIIKYTLDQNLLKVQYHVINVGVGDLIFSIGAHPAFNCPLLPGEKRSDYSLVFEKNEHVERQLIDGGTRNGKTRPVLTDEKILHITDDLFDEDALIFEGLKSDVITIQKGETPILSMNFEGYPYFGIWSKNDSSPFVCLEPWFGIADHQEHNQVLEEKEGVIRLQPEENFQCNYEIIVH